MPRCACSPSSWRRQEDFLRFWEDLNSLNNQKSWAEGLSSMVRLLCWGQGGVGDPLGTLIFQKIQGIEAV